MEAPSSEKGEFADWEKNGGFVLYVIGVFYVFFAFELICNEFFIPALNVVCRRFKLPEDFVGATLMAVGAEAADILTGCIGLLVLHTDVGTGTIAGSMLFSTLVIVGASVIAVGTLELDVRSVSRDLLFFAASLVLLMFSLLDCAISVYEAAVFVVMYVLYVLVCYYTDAIANLLNRIRGREARKPSEAAPLLAGTDIQDDEEEEALQEPPHPPVKPRDMAVLQRLSRLAFHESMLSLKLETGEQQGNQYGAVAAHGWLFRKSPFYELVRVGSKTWEKRWFVLDENLWYCRDPKEPGRTKKIIPIWEATNVQLGERDDTVIRVFTGEQVYTFKANSKPEAVSWVSAIRERIRYLNVDDPEAGSSSDLPKPSRAAIPDGATIDTFEDEDEWLLSVPPAEEGRFKRILWALTLPFAVLFTFTIPNVKRRRFRKFFILTFLLVVAWLGVLVYGMVWAADRFAAIVGIPADLMGITLTGVGATMPSFFGSIIVAKQGNAKMAVSSAIGSNTTMILLAFGLPFFIQTAFVTPGKDLILDSGSITTTVIILLGVVVLFILVAAVSRMRLKRPVGIAFILLFLVLLAIVVVLNIFDLDIHW